MTVTISKMLGTARKLVCTPVNHLLNRIDPPVIVLLYHRVTRRASDPELLAVTPENFRAQMQHLKENHPLVRFEEDWSNSPRPAVAVTFDDGYADNAREALPILTELGIPATFFLSSANLGSAREFWWDELGRLLLQGERFPGSFTLSRGARQERWPTGSAPERERLYGEIVPRLTDADLESRDAILVQLRAWAGKCEEPDVGNRSLSFDELTRLAGSELVSIGAHTVNHCRLSALPLQAQREEIEGSRHRLEDLLDREIASFSYPYGKHCHYTRESVALCRELGFRKAAANFPGQSHRWSDPYQVPRHLVRDWPVELFAAKLKGFWTR
jgi:peptidoglycan/xylan/chitin deacetylase (PgdA/CDA1 family)